MTTVGTPGARRLVIAAAVSAALVLPSSALADFTPPVFLSLPGQETVLAKVAIWENGDAIAVWLREDGANQRVLARVREANGTLGPLLYLSGAGQDAEDPQVDIDPDGAAYVVWNRSDGVSDRIQGRAIVDGDPHAVQTFSAPGGTAVMAQVAVDDEGDAVVTWKRYDGSDFRAQARSRTNAGVLGAIRNLSAAGDQADRPQVAIDANGDAILAWAQWDDDIYRIQARTLSRTGTLGPIRRLSPDGEETDFLDVAMDADGDALVGWTSEIGSDQRVRVRAVSSAGIVGALQTLSPAGRVAEFLSLAVSDGGVAHIVWQEGGSPVLYTRFAPAGTEGGVFGLIRQVSATGVGSFYADVAVDDAGTARIVWTTLADIETRTRTAAGVFGPIATISQGHPNYEPSVAVGSAGQSAVTWSRLTNSAITRTVLSVGP